MPTYIFKTSGIRRNIFDEFERSFDATDESAAIAYAENTLAPEAKAVFSNSEKAIVTTSDHRIIGVLGMRSGTWQLGDVPFNDHPAHLGYSHNDMRPALDLIVNPDNWKLPIDAAVPADADRTLIEAAAAYFCGSPVDFVEENGMIRVIGPGYYECIGA